MNLSIYVFVCFVLLMLYAIVIIAAVDGWQKQPISNEYSATSLDDLTIVVAVRNVAQLPQLPQGVKTIIVDDHSENPLQGTVSNPYEQGKKWALRYGFECATTRYVVTTDADTILSPSWLETIASRLASDSVDMLILPLRMSKTKGLFSALQETEYNALQTLTGGYALLGKPIMCSGANLVVDRQKWLDSWEDIKPEIPSGDDMFMLQSFKRQGLKIDFLKSQSACAQISPSATLSDLLRQRSRWAGKAVSYSDPLTIAVAVAVVIGNLAVLLCYPLVLVKWVIDLYLLWISQVFFDFKHAFFKSLLLSLVYPIYMLIVLIISPFRRAKW